MSQSYGIRTSKGIAKIAAAFVAAQGKFPAVIRNQDNEYGKQFADLAAHIEATRPVLLANKLAVLQAPSMDRDKETVTITTRLQHASGQFYESDLEIPIFEEAWAKDNLTAQVVGSAISYACRYAYRAILGLANEDDDGRAASRIPPEYKRTDNKKPGTHPEIVAGELIEVRAGDLTGKTYYARLTGVANKLWIRDEVVRTQLRQVVGELIEVECRVSDYADHWELERVLKVGEHDMTTTEGQLEASLRTAGKGKAGPQPIVESLDGEREAAQGD